MKFGDKKWKLKQVIIAYDALAQLLIQQKVSKLMREQLEKIFTGAIKTGKK
jgi:phosphate transport system substrate-binding protein